MTLKTPVLKRTKLNSWLSRVYWSIVSFGAAYLTATEVGATAIENLEKHSKSLNVVVKGSLGQTVLFIATFGGMFSAVMKGNIWLAVGIFLVGIVLVWHIENLATIFS